MVLQNTKNGTATRGSQRGILVPQQLWHATVYIQPKTSAQRQNTLTGQPDSHFVRNMSSFYASILTPIPLAYSI
jgi:hypothetical protein